MYIPEWTLSNLATAIVSIVGSCALVAREFSPATRLNYSKFNSASRSVLISFDNKISSYNGMLLIYTPSLILSILLLVLSYDNHRMLLVSAMLLAHYLKRVLEVMFVHRYSGQCNLKDNLLISMSYFSFSLVVYKLSSNVPDPSSKVAYIGVILFLVGECTNFYHHLILKDLRKDGSKDYKIPSGALFDYVWCPHYTGEIISFVAIVLVTQHFLVLILQAGSAAYLTTRAYNTKKWYIDKFETIPDRACLIPFVF